MTDLNIKCECSTVKNILFRPCHIRVRERFMSPISIDLQETGSQTKKGWPPTSGHPELCKFCKYRGRCVEEIPPELASGGLPGPAGGTAEDSSHKPSEPSGHTRQQRAGTPDPLYAPGNGRLRPRPHGS